MILINRAATAFWGASWLPGQMMEDFLRVHQIGVLDGDGQRLTRDHLATFRAFRTSQAVRQYQEVIRRPDGTQVPVLFNAVVLPPASFESLPLDVAVPGESGVLVVMQDI